MANEEQVARLKQGVSVWNAWCNESRIRGGVVIRGDFAEADLSGMKLNGANLNDAILIGAHLDGAFLGSANLSGAFLGRAILIEASLLDTNLSETFLIEADLSRARLDNADLSGAILSEARLPGTSLYKAKLGGAFLRGANLSGAFLSEAKLSGANLSLANLTGANLTEADLSGASLDGANLTGADLRGADLTGCSIYGVSAWGLKLENAKQHNLIITRQGEPKITVDNIEVAQFIYLLLYNEKLRGVIDTITSKVVLILGRFTDERKVVLDALREALRKLNYLPILFDFAVPATRDITETVSLLAGMARFIIADVTDPSSIPKELEAIVPNLAVPVQPLLEGSSRPYAMFKDYYGKYDWVLPVYRYEGLEPLLLTLADKVIAPAEGKVNALQERRRMIELELTNPQ
ncbi:MAG: pentapeptide repeat-containing protein [Steroidobacteraceae bacterium]|jgi:uncharacterized protein YjbI with pentapeptide repeats